MSLTIEVIRGLGDRPGPELSCRYFESEEVFRQVGRVEIDKSAQGLKIVTITLPGMRRAVRPGEIIRIIDAATEHRARVRSIQYSVGRQEDGRPYAVCSLGLRSLEVI